jgi:hypothetical protein
MAAIDKMYLKDYYVFDEFRLWCLIHNPKLLKRFYNWNMTRKDWNELKENIYQQTKLRCELNHVNFSSIESLKEYYLTKSNYIAPLVQLAKEVSEHLQLCDELANKDLYLKNITLSITNFSCKEDKYLLWHCPIEEVREYLTKQCGYKERWYYKLFFKY